jgi:3alpha(or 20beta)-hydroxysteroid dehydrogenase
VNARLSNRVAIVTGAARGQGAEHVRRLVAEGARVVGTDLREEEGQAVAAEFGEKAAFRRHDVAEESDWAEVVEFAVGSFGRLDVLVNNAAIAPATPLLTTETEQYMEVIRVNQLSVFLGMRAVAPPMAGGGGGSIINVSSTAGLVGMPSRIAYVASKFAVRGMSKSAAVELGPMGIRVNSIHPGTIDTPMMRQPDMEDMNLDSWFSKLPVPRIGNVEDVAALVAFLASDDSAYISGTEIPIDGGLLAQCP